MLMGSIRVEALVINSLPCPLFTFNSNWCLELTMFSYPWAYLRPAWIVFIAFRHEFPLWLRCSLSSWRKWRVSFLLHPILISWGSSIESIPLIRPMLLLLLGSCWFVDHRWDWPSILVVLDMALIVLLTLPLLIELFLLVFRWIRWRLLVVVIIRWVVWLVTSLGVRVYCHFLRRLVSYLLGSVQVGLARGIQVDLAGVYRDLFSLSHSCFGLETS
jgi:hypothetical protein